MEIFDPTSEVECSGGHLVGNITEGDEPLKISTRPVGGERRLVNDRIETASRADTHHNEHTL